jgi:diguanylate cyclase (GGDEF)-like protein
MPGPHGPAGPDHPTIPASLDTVVSTMTGIATSPDDGRPHPPGHRINSKAARKLKILIVDDDAADRFIVRRALQLSGVEYQLTEAYDGATALKACENEVFDCVFLDFRLPDSDGAAVFKTMLSHYDGGAAVIFLTGLNDEGLAMQMMGNGAVDFLTKAEITPTIINRAVRYATARQNFQKQLSEQARIDMLTGLPNRSAFLGTLTKEVAQAKRTGSLVSVALLDLDHFKDVNDTLGHDAGDNLLKQTADRLQAVLRETDTVIRLGGDEFVVIAPNLRNADGAAKQAQKIINALSVPFEVQDQKLFISTSIGIALAPSDAADSDKLLKSADMALYKAKADGRGRYHFYDEQMNFDAQNRRVVEAELRQAIIEGEFELYYQPKINLSDGRVLGSEALIRWNQPERGLIAPDNFIPVAESCQLINQIGEWVLQESCRQNMAWQAAGLPPLNCSVNLSPLQMRDSGLIGAIDGALERSGFDPKCLEVEITESAILDNVKSITALLSLLRARGISVSIDDFGTGYSSLSHLKHLPVDKLKIDRSFVSEITGNAGDAEITSATISLGQTFGLKVIGEGVEEQAQLDFLHEKGCDQAQGYFISRPLPAADFAEWYRHRESDCKISWAKAS